MALAGIACVSGVLFLVMALRAKPRQWRETIIIWSICGGAVVATFFFLIANPQKWSQALKTGVVAGGGGLSFVVSIGLPFRPFVSFGQDGHDRLSIQ